MIPVSFELIAVCLDPRFDDGHAVLLISLIKLQKVAAVNIESLPIQDLSPCLCRGKILAQGSRDEPEEGIDAVCMARCTR
ncbi:hypothetical protein M1N84_04175 [Dehalococcoidia bacterium]|nr:hypothetical protein [Dehalococcoidia bacterium]